MRSLRIVAVVVVTVAVGCEIAPTNPLDPGTDPEFQQRAILKGSVRAVTAPDDDGTVPAPGPCASVEGGDHSGFIVVLRGLADTGDGVLGESQATNASGQFEFTDVPAGAYVVDVVREGFALPAATELTIAFGERRTLPALCAVKRAPPSSPLVEAPPALVDIDTEAPGADVDAAIRVSAEEGLSFRLRETPDGGATARDVVVDAGVLVPLVLDETPGIADDDVRRAWRVDVIAVDLLGNESLPTSFLVVKDGLAPLPPTLSALPSRDRVQLELAAAAARQDEGVVVDDAAASFLVAYAVVAPAAGDGPCPFGTPDADAAVDPVVHASFAVEGQSPIAVANDALTLSGLQPGTDMIVLAAAVDAAGNASCWSAPLPVRPDIVTLTPSTTLLTDPLGAARRLVESDGAFAFARGDAGLVVVDRDGVSHTVDDAPALDVATLGETLLVASGALGLRVIDLDDDGAPGVARSIALGGRSAEVVLARPGRALVGGVEGLTSVPLDGGAFAARSLDGDDDGGVVGLAGWGGLLLVVRDGAEPALEVHRLSDVDNGVDARVGRVALPVLPSDLVVVDGRVWLTQSTLGTAVVDVSACATDDVDCAVLVGRRSLRAGAAATSLAGYDDAVLVADDDGRVTVAAFSAGAVTLIGGFETGGRVDGVVAVNGGVCAGVDDVAGSRLSCLASVQAPLVDEERRLGLVEGNVTRVAHALGQGVHARAPLAGGSVASLYGFDDGVIALTTAGDGELLTAAVPGTGFIVGDALLRHDGSVGVVDLSGALEDAGLVAPFVGFGTVTGDRLTTALVAQGGPVTRAVIFSAGLVETAAGLVLTQPAVEDLPDDVNQVITAVRRRGRVFFGTAPFGLFSIGVSGGAVVVEQPLEADGRLVDVAFLPREGAPDQVVVAGTLVEGGAPRERLFPVEGGVLDRNGGLEFGLNAVRGMTAFGRLLVVSTTDDGAVFVDDTLRPVLQVPTVSQVGQTLATARGLLCADGAAGTAWLVIR